MANNGRTDMASELHRRLCEQRAIAELPGVCAREETLRGFAVTEVRILDPRGAELLGRPVGRYLTMELPRGPLDAVFPEAVRALAELIRRCVGKRPGSVLVVALGNPDITPDALGSLSATQILVTRHLIQQGVPAFAGFCSTSLCRPGVLGSSGVESASQIRALCGLVSPELVIAIDALAGAEISRLCRSVQICDTGIAPGSGVGNAREAIDREGLGVPVIAIGTPTVTDAAGVSEDPELRGMFVTPRSIDSQVRSCARLIGFAVDLALQEQLSYEDLLLLLGDGGCFT
ncbi:MAG: GPR endopeptidase [Oscillospiraceae bacterium]|nr:GPR endopeptidase [Oscillospiraceae bacterium]